jgi:ankyrin repeat protein
MLDAGAYVNVKDQNEATPLHILLESKGQRFKSNAIKLLSKYGALPDEANINGLTPLHLAIQQRHFDVAQYLLEHGADHSKPPKTGLTALQLAAVHSDFPDALWNMLGNISALNEDGQSALHIAARNQTVVELENLIKHGANIESRNTEGETPLHLGVRHYVKGRHQS